jgi:phosphate:Na+ symporter
MIFLQIAGGVALVLFAVRFLRKGLDRLFGQHLMNWIERMTSHRLKAFGAGVVAGAIAPSSTALSVTLIQLLNASQLSAERVLATLLGANIGITVMVQLLSFSASGLAAFCILVGVIGFQFLTREVFRGLGQIMLSLGFVFLSMDLIASGSAMIDPHGDMVAFMHLLEGHPIAVLLASSLAALLLQSSTATIALAIGLGSSAHIGMALIVPWVLGTNLGIALTAIAAGWSTVEGRRLGMANFLVKGLAAAAALPLIPWIVRALDIAHASPARQSANFHTLFNVAVALLTLPFAALVSRLVAKMIVPPTPQATGVPLPQTFLDPAAVDTPAFALAQATRELLAMGDEVKSMLQTWWRAFCSGDLALLRLIADQDHRVDATYHRLKKFLSLIRDQEPGDRHDSWHLTLHTFSNDLEDIGDIVSSDLCVLVRKQVEHRTVLTPADWTDLEELYHKLNGRYDVAMSILTTRDANLARSFASGKEALDLWCRERQRLHYERLPAGDETALRSSSIFLEILNDLRRINSHLSVIGYTLRSPAEPIPAAIADAAVSEESER